MESIYLLEAVGSALPASFPRKESRVPTAEETETRVKFDWLAESLAGLGCLMSFRKSFIIPLPFFFDLFATVDECWSAMEIMRLGERHELLHLSHQVGGNLGNLKSSTSLDDKTIY